MTKDTKKINSALNDKEFKTFSIHESNLSIVHKIKSSLFMPAGYYWVFPSLSSLHSIIFSTVEPAGTIG